MQSLECRVRLPSSAIRRRAVDRVNIDIALDVSQRSIDRDGVRARALLARHCDDDHAAERCCSRAQYADTARLHTTSWVMRMTGRSDIASKCAAPNSRDIKSGRGDWIRTSDPQTPSLVR